MTETDWRTAYRRTRAVVVSLLLLPLAWPASAAGVVVADDPLAAKVGAQTPSASSVHKHVGKKSVRCIQPLSAFELQ